MSRDRWPLHLPCRLLLVLSALPGCLLDLQEVDRDCQVDTDCFADEVCDQAVQYCRRGERQCPPEGSWDLSDLTGRGLDARSGEQALGAPQSGRYAQHIALDDGSTWEGSCRWQASKLHCLASSASLTWSGDCTFTDDCRTMRCTGRTSDGASGGGELSYGWSRRS